ncbi:MAG: hypothetical protein AAGE86_02675 [Pseudomonadota bacterium]
MAIKADASTWTGLRPERRAGDIRSAQRPVVGGPKALDAQEFGHRLVNWPNLLFLLPIWLVISLTSDGGFARALWLAAIYLGLFVAISLFVYWNRQRKGTSTALRLSQHGLDLPLEHVEPIPWSRIGHIGYANGRFVGLISVEVDPAHELVRRPPWPFNAGNGATVKMAEQVILLSTWNIHVQGDALIAALERFRDNYCGE